MLHEYGKSKVEVVDNGMGIDSFDFLGKKGSTSKNKLNDKFDYLGFRGEAVHSIGRVSGAMEI
jgi:DNA mismatch repair ATPase MutL